MIQPNTDCCPSVASSAGRAAAPSAAGATSDRDALVALVRRADSGDPVAQRELVQRYQRRVAGFVRAIIRQPDAVEDVTQIVFIKMFRRLSRLRDPGVFESWLFTLARNTGLDFIRRRSCRPSTVGLDEEVNDLADPAAADGTGEILAALDHALARLAPVDRRLVSRFVAGDSYGEIAAEAGLSLATVKVRLHRVRPFLRSCVGEMTGTRQAGDRRWGSAAAKIAA